MDNYSLWEAHEDRLDRELAKLPVCDGCGHPIQDERAYHDGDKWLCMDCLSEYLVDVEDYIE